MLVLNTLRTPVRILEPVKETFAERLVRLRTARGYRPTDLAHRLGVTEGTVRHWESGHTKEPSLSVGIKLAKSLGVSPEYLASGRGITEAAPPPEGDVEVRLERQDEAISRLERMMRTVLERGIGDREAVAQALEEEAATQPHPRAAKARRSAGARKAK